jgi:hypothetical protein
MNELREIWQQEPGNADLLEQMLQNKTFRHGNFQTPLAKLKRNLAIHIGYAAIITIGYALIIFYFAFWQVQACMVLLIAFNLWAMVTSYTLYQNIDLNLSGTNVLNELKKHYHAFMEWEKQSMRAGLMIYPFAAAGGFMLGGAVGSGKSPEVWLSDSRIMIIMAIVVMVLVPLGYLVAKWMTSVAFGRYVVQLRERINELEAEG